MFTFHSLKAILSKKKIVFRYVNTVYLGSMVITMRSIRAAGSEVEHFHGSVMYLGLSGNFIRTIVKYTYLVLKFFFFIV